MAALLYRAAPVRCFGDGAVDTGRCVSAFSGLRWNFFLAINSFRGSRHNRRHNTRTTLIFNAFLCLNIPCAMGLRLIPRSLRRSGVFVTVANAMQSIVVNFAPASRR
jgi:hypothetical protein